MEKNKENHYFPCNLGKVGVFLFFFLMKLGKTHSWVCEQQLKILKVADISRRKLIPTKALSLQTANTPNGHKAKL